MPSSVCVNSRRDQSDPGYCEFKTTDLRVWQCPFDQGRMYVGNTPVPPPVEAPRPPSPALTCTLCGGAIPDDEEPDIRNDRVFHAGLTCASTLGLVPAQPELEPTLEPSPLAAADPSIDEWLGL